MDEWLNGIIAKLEAIKVQYDAELKSVHEAECKKQGHFATVEYNLQKAEVIKELFRDAVQEFYDAYDPIFYGGERRGSLFEVLDISCDAEGIILNDDSAQSMYDRDKMGKGRSGNDLFDKVFMQGWHGGAESGRDHPSPGTPYYRKPYGAYWHWGRPAVRTTSPNELFENKLNGASSDFQASLFSIGTKYAEIAAQNTTKIIPSLQAKYFG